MAVTGLEDQVLLGGPSDEDHMMQPGRTTPAAIALSWLERSNHGYKSSKATHNVESLETITPTRESAEALAMTGFLDTPMDASFGSSCYFCQRALRFQDWQIQ
jgi:hypothetical protein